MYPNSNSYLGIYSSAMRSAAEEAWYQRDLNHLQPNLLRAAGIGKIRALEHTIPIGLLV
jgi:hypothetical protein